MVSPFGSGATRKYVLFCSGSSNPQREFATDDGQILTSSMGDGTLTSNVFRRRKVIANGVDQNSMLGEKK